MKEFLNLKEIEKISKLLQEGKIGILPTDTVYGIHCLTWNKEAVERIYQIKKRDPNRPFLVLISSIDELGSFGITPTLFQKKVLNKVWPGPISIVFPCKNKKIVHLRRGKNSLAFRLPRKLFLKNLLQRCGSLVSTSANLSGQKTVVSAKDAQKIFGDQIDFLVDGGELNRKPSVIISFDGNQIKVLRKGDGDLKKLFSCLKKE